MRSTKHKWNVLAAASALVFAGAQFYPKHQQHDGPVLTKAVAIVAPKSDSTPVVAAESVDAVTASSNAALAKFSGLVRPMSRPEALELAFRSYFAYKAQHPNDVAKPYLYFVDYGLASTEKRGYVFDMESLTIIDGPFTVAHGRGSASAGETVPTRFSNTSGAATTSLGLYVAKSLYAFSGHAAGQLYHSIGLRLQGVSRGFNDNAMARGVVAHGAPYVTSNRAGRSEGCPAMEPDRAQRLLPKLAQGGMVFLFAPNDNWMQKDQWVNGSATLASSGSVN